MFDAQLEMSFESGAICLSRPQRRLGRAQWWFQRMRQVVDRAMDWRPVPSARPEQMWFPTPGSQSEVVPAVATGKAEHPIDEHEMWE